MIVLTRYLYIRDDALASLLLSIWEKKRDEALFWAYELYYSGFQEWVANFLYTVYRQNFWSLNPNLNDYMLHWSNENKTDITFIGNMVVNMTSLARKFDISHTIFRSMPTEIALTVLPKKTVVIYLRASQVTMYETIDHTQETNRKILQKVCLYEIRKELTAYMNSLHAHLSCKELFILQTQYWLYYASFSPVWYTRIVEFGGVIDHEIRNVEFEEDDLQNFYELYGYEPDEQSTETLSKICRLENAIQLSRNGLAERFGCRVKTVPKKMAMSL
jgi:uncharacterized membrane protein YfbV (UPF0208 family)